MLSNNTWLFVCICKAMYKCVCIICSAYMCSFGQVYCVPYIICECLWPDMALYMHNKLTWTYISMSNYIFVHSVCVHVTCMCWWIGTESSFWRYNFGHVVNRFFRGAHLAAPCSINPPWLKIYKAYWVCLLLLFHFVDWLSAFWTNKQEGEAASVHWQLFIR